MKKRKPFSADTIFWTIVAAAAICALLFFLFGPKERWVSKSYSVDLGAAEEPVLVADFSRIPQAVAAAMEGRQLQPVLL